MQETPPPFYSRTRNRTRPTRRRMTPDEPDLGRFRRQLSRTSVILAAFIAIVSIGSAAVIRSRSSAPDAPAAAPADAVLVTVSRIIDGDTLEVRSAETTLRVRL